MDGAGVIESTGSGAISGLEVTWAARVEPEQSERTSPEELLAAAHAACFCMALSHGLAQAGNAPEKLDVTATSTFVPGTGITQMKLDVTGTVSGVDEAAFVEAAEAARDNCPVSDALKGNVEILLDARLAS
jgi:lipoyl-dependent peroxiredoxin